MTKRRGNREGTITRRADGRWEARITLEDGKRKCFYGKTRQEVAARLLQAQHDVDKGLPVLDERQTLEQYLATWTEAVKAQIRGSSWRRYRDYVHIHLIPGLGRISLAKLTPQQVQLLYARKLGEGLSPSTVHHMHGVLHRALDDALRMGLVQRNVTDMVRAPRRRGREMVALTEEQGRQLLQAVEGDRFEVLYVLALTTGMREGELLVSAGRTSIWIGGRCKCGRMSRRPPDAISSPRRRPPIPAAISRSPAPRCKRCGIIASASMRSGWLSAPGGIPRWISCFRIHSAAS